MSLDDFPIQVFSSSGVGDLRTSSGRVIVYGRYEPVGKDVVVDYLEERDLVFPVARAKDIFNRQGLNGRANAYLLLDNVPANVVEAVRGTVIFKPLKIPEEIAMAEREAVRNSLLGEVSAKRGEKLF